MRLLPYAKKGNRDVRVTLGMKLLFAAGIASMSLFWMPVPADPPRIGSAVLVIEQPAPADDPCPFV